MVEAEEYETDSGEEEDWWRQDLKIGDKVQVSYIQATNSQYVALY